MASAPTQLAKRPDTVRIGLVCPYDLGTPGGVQNHVLGLARRLSTDGVEVSVIGPGTLADPEIRSISTGPSVSLRGNDSRVPLGVSPMVVPRVRTALDGTDLVHIHEPFAPMVGWAACSTDHPSVLTFHADPRPWVRRTYRLARPILSRMSSRVGVSAVSPVAAAAVPFEHVHIIPNGIDLSDYRDISSRRPDQIVFVGRDEPRKGLDVALAAFERIRRRVPNAGLMVIGARRSPAPSGVTFMGRVGEGEKRRILSASAVLLAPNLGGESFGIVLIEAMAAGCAVVASALPAFVDVLAGSGMLCPVGDVDALATAVVEIITDPHARSEMARRGSARVAGFDWRKVCDDYLELYRSVLDQ